MRWLLRGIFVAVVALFLPAFAVAGPYAVPLVQPDSFVGWDYGGSTAGWANRKGQLIGTEPAAELLSGWTFGDVTLTLRWKVADSGVLLVRFPEVPNGPGLTLRLSDDDQCALLKDGDEQLAPGRELPTEQKNHTLELVRAGGKLSVTVDGHPLYEVEVDAKRRFGLGLAVAKGTVVVWDIRAEEPRGKAMFNGKDFSGWWTKGNIRNWIIEGNEVRRSEKRAGDYLRTEKEYGNFTWTFEYLLEKNGNSGLSVRTPRDGWPTADGMELQLLDRPYDAVVHDQPCMAVYGHVPPLARAYKSEKWNRVVVKADGYIISAWVNGKLVQHVNTYFHPELKHRPLKGWLGFQDHGDWIRVRDVRILEAPDGLGLEAWYRPKPLSAVQIVLDRLINRVLLADSIGTSAVTAYARFDEQEPVTRTIANFKGPAVLTRIVYLGSGDEAELAFYFDGQRQPRLVSKISELANTLPHVGKNNLPFLTCLPFKQSLKVELRGAKQAEVRLDCVRFPGNVALESFTTIEKTFPRGWLDAVTTILRWTSSGRYHEYDLLERQSAGPVDLAPGVRQELIKLEGSGIVHRLKLRIDRQLLENDDLWLEVYVDGRNEPAIAAPVRFVFAGLTSNYGNYMMADQGGLTWFMPMPFGKGLVVALVNKGGRTLRGVSVEAAVEKADQTDQDLAAMWRLHGLFLPADENSNLLVSCKGRTRLVGLVYELPPVGDTGIATVLIDGRPQSGWSADTLDSFLGNRGQFRSHLSGRQSLMCWRYMLEAPIECQQSLQIKLPQRGVGARLLLFYAPR